MHAHQNVCGSRIHHLGFPLSYVSVTLAPLHHRSLSHPQTVTFSTTLAMSTLVTSIYLLALLAEKRDVKVHTSSTNSEAQNSNRFHESFNVLVENLLSIFANIIPVCVGQNKEKTHLLGHQVAQNFYNLPKILASEISASSEDNRNHYWGNGIHCVQSNTGKPKYKHFFAPLIFARQVHFL